MTRRPTFWLTFGALALAGVTAAVTLFSSAFPSITVDITMDRAAAVDSAAALATRYSWGEPDDRSAATFGLADPIVQTYVELEGGGPDVVEGLAERNVYEAYQWRVRRFAEGRVEESATSLTPAGVPYGFRLRLAEDDPGEESLDASAARETAEATAAEWGVDMTAYDLLESSAETLPSGRVDHTFVYERVDERLAEARFRLRLVVAGSRTAELTHFVQVPEAFSRRYADMRSTNDSIALIAQAVLLVVFGLLGAGVGSALLLRARWLEWRAPLAWGGIIAVLFGAATVNQLPLTWSAYDTALSANSFVLQQLAGGAAIAILGTPLIAFFLMAGESLGRRAFPGHVQQWRFWSPEVAASNTALGMTSAAYLMVGIQVGYVIVFYLGTSRLEGWWSPADVLVQPDLLATYFPWLEAVSLALFASFWEESLFRAVPIACAALLGARFGRKGLWIWGAVLVQAVVFAAGHANYPQQPPYARVIELTVPALVWGVVYVRYGLVPTIMAHFLYDLSLISIVLFESDALLDQAVIVAVGIVPLAVVVAARRRVGARSAPPEWALNGGWAPRPRPEAAGGAPVGAAAAPEPVPTPTGPEDGPDQEGAAAPPAAEPNASGGPAERRPHGMPRWAPWAALALGMGALAWATIRTTLPPALEGSRASAVETATAELAPRGVDMGAWDVFVTTASGASQGMDYVLREAGEDAFADLQGRYFGEPRWLVRLVDWDAEPEERVEEYRVYVGPDGEAVRVTHTLPEGRPGASLDVESARRLALDAIAERQGLSSAEVREVEAQETSRPARTDWLFTFAEVGRLQDVEGEARISVRVAGDEVADVATTIQVPEAWQRDRRRLESRGQIMGGGLGLLLVLLFGGATVTAVVVWSRHGLPVDVFTKLSAVAFVALVASTLNDWPTTAAAFGTGQPWTFQVSATVIGLVIAACVASPAIGLVGALGHAWLGEIGRPRLGAAAAYGLLFGGLAVLAPTLAPGPQAGRYMGAASAVPLLSPALGALPAFLVLASGLLCVVASRKRFGHQIFVTTTLWSLVFAISVVTVPTALQASVLSWAGTAILVWVGLAAGLYVCSSQPVLIPGIVAVFLAVRTLADTWWQPYAGARIGGVLGVALLGVLASRWMRELADSGREPGPGAQSVAETRASVGSE